MRLITHYLNVNIVFKPSQRDFSRVRYELFFRIIPLANSNYWLDIVCESILNKYIRSCVMYIKKYDKQKDEMITIKELYNMPPINYFLNRIIEYISSYKEKREWIKQVIDQLKRYVSEL